MRSLAVTGVVVAALLAGTAGAGGTSAAATQHAIVVTGNGSVATVPDRAQLSFGVSSDARTASAALRANAAEMTKVIAAVKGQGIAAADIRTEQVSLSPRYTQDGEGIIGYTVTNSVGVTLRNLDKTGGVIDAAVEAGANRAALRAAIADAEAKAQTIARASGLALRRITDVSENGGPTPVAEPTAKVGTAPSTPIEPGTQLVEATVTVTFAVA